MKQFACAHCGLVRIEVFDGQSVCRLCQLERDANTVACRCTRCGRSFLASKRRGRCPACYRPTRPSLATRDQLAVLRACGSWPRDEDAGMDDARRAREEAED